MLRVLKPGGRLILTYDLITNNSSYNDQSRYEIFTPQTIDQVLQDLNIQMNTHYSADDVLASLSDIKHERVDIPDGITVGGMVIVKNI
jgi:hypothetical protein